MKSSISKAVWDRFFWNAQQPCVTTNYTQGKITPAGKSKQAWVPSKNHGARNRVFGQKQLGARKIENLNKHKGRDQGKPRSFTTNPFPQQSVLLSTTVVPGSTLENWTMKETPYLPLRGLIVCWHELTTCVWVGMTDLNGHSQRQRPSFVKAAKTPPPMRHILLPMLTSSFWKSHSYSTVGPYHGNKNWEIPESKDALQITYCGLSAPQQWKGNL